MAARTPAAAFGELLAADRAAAAAATRDGSIAALTAAMTADVTMPARGVGLVEGVDAVRAALARDPRDAGATADWTPIGGGLSADGAHGFTYGFLETRRADGSTGAGKYLAYWTKGDRGWRVAAYRRIDRAAGAVDRTPRPPLLPAALVAPSRDAGATEQARASLLYAERAFARESQEVGLQAGFTKFGSPQAINLGGAGKADFVTGNVAIAADVSQGAPAGRSPVDWWPERALVASSGDLGITFGYITPNDPPPAGQAKPRFAFFTIWHRPAPAAAWRYVGE